MIIEAILEFFANIIVSLIQLFPDFEMPTWLNIVSDFWNNTFTSLYKLKMFVPLEAIYNVLLLLIAAQIAYIGTKIVRIIISNFTGGGGAV